jgi:hypothetical protein
MVVEYGFQLCCERHEYEDVYDPSGSARGEKTGLEPLYRPADSETLGQTEHSRTAKREWPDDGQSGSNAFGPDKRIRARLRAANTCDDNQPCDADSARTDAPCSPRLRVQPKSEFSCLMDDRERLGVGACVVGVVNAMRRTGRTGSRRFFALASFGSISSETLPQGIG